MKAIGNRIKCMEKGLTLGRTGGNTKENISSIKNRFLGEGTNFIGIRCVLLGRWKEI